MYVYARLSSSAHTHAGVHSDLKKASDPLDLEQYAAVNCLMWALGTALWSSGGAASAFNH